MYNSLLNKVRKEDLKTEPYPYVVIKNALEESYYNELESAFPSNESIAGTSNMENNTRYQISANKSFTLPKIWREFVDYHVSESFYKEFVSLFGDFFPEKKSWAKTSNIFTRGSGKPKSRKDLQMDCQLAINSPVSELSSVKGPHVDNRIEWYAGLFYMRADQDDSHGGGLEIFKPKDPNMEFVNKKEYDLDLLEKVDEVPYEKNTFVMFLCTKHSLHGVQPRGVTKHSRRFVNVISEFSSGKKAW
tara:strand:- start:638 stop:1375 length:738 start_codon:yes stop_codon:yes gene_type:complete